MDRISGLNHIIEALRKQLDPSSRKSKASDGKKEQKNPAESAASSALNLKQLEQRVIDRIRTVNDDDQNPRNKASYVLVESILAWEFGEEMLKDPDFSEIVNKVNQAIQTDASLNNKIDQLLLEIVNK